MILPDVITRLPTNALLERELDPRSPIYTRNQ